MTLAEIRAIVADERAEFGHRLSFQIVDRALRQLDGDPVETIADRLFIATLTPDEVAESPWAVAAARLIYAVIDASHPQEIGA